MKNKLFVIDGHALCYRAYYAFINNPLKNSKGQNTSAIFGFARMLLKLINDQNPDYLVVAFDPPGKSFRFDLYPEYKAKRQKMPDDLRPQIEEIKNMLSVLGIQKLEHENYEADDILGTIAAKYGSDTLEIMLVTGDKDAYQLVNDNVKIYANKKGITDFELYDTDAVFNKLGITPEQVIDYMALMGDSSDNIPGVQGVGEKTAQKLISTYNTLDNIYNHIEEVNGQKLRNSLSEKKEMAYISKDLVTIRTNVPVDISFENAVIPDFKSNKIKTYFTGLEMNAIIQDIFGNEEIKPEKKEENKNYIIIKTGKDLKELIKLIQKNREISVDTETTSLNPIEAEIVGISISMKEKEGWYVPIYSNNLFDENMETGPLFLSMLKPVLEDESIKKIGQNIKYDILTLKNAGIEMKGIYFDTMLAAYLINPESRYNMDDLAESYLNYKTIHYEDLVGKGKKALPITDIPVEDLAEYAVEDADITFRLYKLFKLILKEQEMDSLFYNIEMPLVSVLALMEWNGVKISTSRFRELNKENQELLDHVENNIYKLAGQKFNINSTRELSSILFEKLGLKTVRKTKTGFSTDIRVLETLKGSHEIIEHLISYRTLSKLKNTYIEKLPQIISPKTGRIHTSYNQTVAATGRLSSSNPNLQNIPIRDEFGKKIRSAFVPEKGQLLISADYSQIELRLAAHFSEDTNMINAFKEGTDIHNLTASSVFNVSIDDVTADMRRQAKIINFATIYGVSPFGLSQQAEIDIHQAADFIKKYFETYPGFRNYIDSIIAFAKENGYVKTLLGRKRFISDLDSKVSFRREGAERIAINTPIQGTAADMIKIAMVNIQKHLDKNSMNSKMILQVHDELVFETPSEEKDKIIDLIRTEMEGAIKLKVPATVDISFGKNWDEAH
ncbi:MAG: DNA polymerase I [Spirochaetes bacterium]|nr:DNA polymerase I [Spirochaetota bacterium]